MAEPKKVFLISTDKVGKNMAGPGVRYFEISKVLAKHFEVTLLTPGECDLKSSDFKILSYGLDQGNDLTRLIAKADVVISQNLRPPQLRLIKKLKIHFIADLYDPSTVEVLEYTKYENRRQQKFVFEFNYHSLLLQIQLADHLLCASNRQRDFYTGILSDQKLINPKSYANSPDIKKIISLVPFGLSSEKIPSADLALVKEKIPNLKAKDKIIYWGGGIWNWFDPLSIVRAIAEISKTRSDIKLFFLGVKHPNPKIKQLEMANKTVQFCKKHNLLNEFVFFNFDWTPYQERIHFLSRANIGISTHFDNLETRLSFRTRVLDYLWAELPMILTEGDSMADLCQQKNLGRVVRYQNVADIKKAILELADNKSEIDIIKANIKKVKTDFYWQNCLKDLINLINKDEMKKRQISGIKFWRLSLNYYWAGFKKKFIK